MPRSPLSLVITCPHGVAACKLPDSIRAEAMNGTVEIIAADGQPGLRVADAPGWRYVDRPGLDVYTLRGLGVAAARHEWIVVTEDHCRLPGDFLDRFRAAIAGHHNASLISGAVVNTTTTDTWSMASFLFNFHRHRPNVASPPTNAIIAALGVRKRAIRAEELEKDAGFDFITLTRLAAPGSFVFDPRIVVDHVQKRTLLTSARAHFDNGRASWAFLRALRPDATWRNVLRFAEHNARREPGETMRALQATNDAPPWPMRLRFHFLGLCFGVGSVSGFFRGGGRSRFRMD